MPLLGAFGYAAVRGFGRMIKPPITFVSSTEGSSGTSGTFVVTVPETPGAGDLLLAVGAVKGSGGSNLHPDAPAGWTPVLTGNNVAPRLCIWYRQANSEPLSYNFVSNSGTQTLVSMSLWRGGAVGFNAVSTLATGTSATVTANAVTSTSSGILLMIGAHMTSGSGAIWTPPAGFTEVEDTAFSNEPSIGISYKENGVGTSAQASATVPGSGEWNAVLLQLSN